MAQNSSKDAFKQYLMQKKQVTQSLAQTLSKPEIKELEKREEKLVKRRINNKEKYATDPEYRKKLQVQERDRQRKKRALEKASGVAPKKKPVVKKLEQPQEQIQEQPQEEPQQEEERPVVRKLNPKNLF